MMTENNNIDKRFSKLLSTVEKEHVQPGKQFLDQLRSASLNEFQTHSAVSENQSQKNTISIWRKIMNSNITKAAIAAVILIAVLIGLNMGGSSIAFGQVLEYFQTRSYTFDLTVDAERDTMDSTGRTIQASVWESGKMRVDCSKNLIGDLSTIIDFNTGRSILLFHRNETGVMKEEPILSRQAGGVLAFCTKPIENLWNLRDGNEEQLGEKEIDGQPVTGFRVFQEDAYFDYEITIWADSKNGIPVQVEAIARPLDETYPSMKWILENFNLDVELDEELFRLEMPPGYTLAYQEDLEDLEVDTTTSAESEKIIQTLELWSQDKKDQAIELLASVDWSKPIEFGKEPYIFSFTEKGYIALKMEDQQHVIKIIMADASKIKKITKAIIAKGKTAVENQDYNQGEKYLESASQLGQLLDHNPETMILVRLVGLAAERLTLPELVNLYQTTNNPEKLRQAQQRLDRANAQVDEIKRQASGR